MLNGFSVRLTDPTIRKQADLDIAAHTNGTTNHSMQFFGIHMKPSADVHQSIWSNCIGRAFNYQWRNKVFNLGDKNSTKQAV